MIYLSVPFDGCYWVVPGRLLAGCYPGDVNPAEAQKKLRGLLGAGIRHIVNLTEETGGSYQEELRRYANEMGFEVTCSHRPIRDLHIPTFEHMTVILDEIDTAIASGRPVYVHCLGGKGRTGTVIGCYLARHAFACKESVLDMILQLRASGPEALYPSPETSHQREMVCSWNIGE